jgi:hypothetical protein
MAGLEVVVRPVVFPSIRPAPARVLAPAQNPDQGIATINGSGNTSVSTSWSWNTSVSRENRQIESRRVVDVDRIYQMDDTGKINKQNFVDVERTKKQRVEDDIHGPEKILYFREDLGLPPNVETKITDKLIIDPKATPDEE